MKQRQICRRLFFQNHRKSKSLNPADHIIGGIRLPSAANSAPNNCFPLMSARIFLPQIEKPSDFATKSDGIILTLSFTQAVCIIFRIQWLKLGLNLCFYEFVELKNRCGSRLFLISLQPEASLWGFQYLVIYIPTNLYFYLFFQSIQNFSSTYLYTSLHTICFD